jgi:hypothetical protein
VVPSRVKNIETKPIVPPKIRKNAKAVVPPRVKEPG